MTDDLSTPHPLADSPDWNLYVQGRARQRRSGLVAAVCLVVALVVLVDGLLAQMRGGGSYRIEMLAGTAEAVAGPRGEGRPTAEDMEAFPIPSDAPLSFEFQGFFASYWFGTGMWRGVIHASETAPSGTYGMSIGIRGTPAAQHQTYTVAVFRSLEEQASRSLSLFRRYTGWNPFVFAGALGIIGLGTAVSAFFLARRCDALVRSLGLVEVFKVRPDGHFLRLFAVTGKREVTGKAFVTYDAGLHRLGKAIYDTTAHGISECLFVKGDVTLPEKGAFLAFWEPEVPDRRPDRRGVLTGLVHAASRKGASPAPGAGGQGGATAPGKDDGTRQKNQ